MFNLFKKKIKENLEKAEAMGLITHEELLRLKIERATKELNRHIEKSEGKKKRK